MFPTLVTIGPVTIYSFGLFLGLGLLLGTFYVWQRGRALSFPEEKVLDATLITILGGLAGARLLYVLSNLGQYSNDFWQIFAFWRGGLSFWGAILGGIVAIIIVSRSFRWPMGTVFDLAAPAVALGAFLGYLGALLGGSSYGAATDLPWGVAMQGQIGARHPSQILEAILQLAIFIILLRLRQKEPFSGFLAIVYLLVYSLGRFFLEFLRGDQTHVLGFFSQAQILSILVGGGAALLLYLRLARLRHVWRDTFWRKSDVQPY